MGAKIKPGDRIIIKGTFPVLEVSNGSMITTVTIAVKFHDICGGTSTEEIEMPLSRIKKAPRKEPK